MFQRFCIEIFCFKYKPFGIKKLRTDKGDHESLKGHAVVGKEAAQGKGKGGQNANPPDFSGPDVRAQSKVHPHCHNNGQQGEQELPQGQPKEQALLVVPYFFVDTNFYG